MATTEQAADEMSRGGSFVQKLGALWFAADPANRAILESSFAEYFAAYTVRADDRLRYAVAHYSAVAAEAAAAKVAA